MLERYIVSVLSLDPKGEALQAFVFTHAVLRWHLSFAVAACACACRIQRLEAKLHCFDELNQVSFRFFPVNHCREYSAKSAL